MNDTNKTNAPETLPHNQREYRRLTAEQVFALARTRGVLLYAAVNEKTIKAGKSPMVRENAMSFKKTPFRWGLVETSTRDGARVLMQEYGVWVDIGILWFKWETIEG